jgi:hypothetical protein
MIVCEQARTVRRDTDVAEHTPRLGTPMDR